MCYYRIKDHQFNKNTVLDYSPSPIVSSNHNNNNFVKDINNINVFLF